jgi:TonB family protein
MNRLQKKCLIAATGLHGLLLLILVFGAALMPGESAAPVNRITFFDVSKITDGPTHGGSAGPQEALPPPAPMTPQLPPQPQPVSPPAQPQPQPQPQPVRRVTPTVPDAPSFTPVKPKTTAQDDFTPVEHPPVKQVASNNQSSDAKARQQAENQQRIANQISRGLSHLSGALSKDTAVEMSSGADGGAAAANYADLVQSMYYAAWNQPASVDNSAAVLVSVTVARDGRVVRHEIVKPSGNTTMDNSIQNALENVPNIAPFPEGSKDEERTFTIKFSLAAK